MRPLNLFALFVTFSASPQFAAHADLSVTFAVIGDYGDATAGLPPLHVSNLVKGFNPEFIVTTGDNNYLYGEASTIDANIGQFYSDFIFPYAGAYGPGATTNRFFPVLGNHDWDSSAVPSNQPYLDYFTLPGNERYYEFRWGPLHFFMVDSDGREPDGILSGSAQRVWLQQRLRASGDPWNIVVLHHPPHSSGAAHESNPNSQWPFRNWGAQIVLAGHEHLYERLLVGGLPHIVNGVGGRFLYSFGTPVAGSLVRYNANFGAQRVTANSDAVRWEFITRTPTLRDAYNMPPWRLDGEPEPNLEPIATAGSTTPEVLYASRVGDWLYVAANSGRSSLSDRFIYVAHTDEPSTLQPANWNKAGLVAQRDLFLGEPGYSGNPSWYDAAGTVYPMTTHAESHSGGAGKLVEGAFNMREVWGVVPEDVWVCTAAYGSFEGAGLRTAHQVPAPSAPDGDIQGGEYLAQTLPKVVEQPLSPWVIDGLREPMTPVAINSGRRLYVEQNGEWLYVATDISAASSTRADTFLYVARTPGTLRPANWLKTGSVAAWDYFLARDGVSTFNTWCDSEEDQFLRISRFHNAAENAQVLEGSFNMLQAWGSVPATVSVAVGDFAPQDGGALVTSRQVPAPVVNDGEIQASEFFTLGLYPVPVALSTFYHN